MSEVVSQPLVLRKNSRSSRFASWGGNANSFLDKMLRVLYLFLLFALDFVMFIYSINGRLMEDGKYNEAVLFILGGAAAFFLVLILCFSFSKDLQNGVCALFTMLITAVFFYQFALFDTHTFIEEWLSTRAGWLTFIGIIPACWLVGFVLGIVVFFGFRSTFFMLFVTIVLFAAGGLGIKKNEMMASKPPLYQEVKKLAAKKPSSRDGNLVYFMVPKFPSYQLLNAVQDRNFRELRDLMVGFYAVNGFEVYPNAFVQKNDTMSNMIDIFNQVDYTSTTSGNRSYSEFINSWDFVHGSLDYVNLEANRLYDFLWSSGYNISTYAMPGFNTCIKGNELYTDRCVMQRYQTVSLYDRTKSLEQNIYTLLGEYILSLNIKDLASVAKMFTGMSGIKDMRVTAENRRVSLEGAVKLFDVISNDFKRDGLGQAYIIYVDLPSDEYIYDEFCNLKPRSQWVALADNSLKNGSIDDKRKAYADQAKCLIGKMQEYMDVIKETHKDDKTDIIIQGVTPVRELAGMIAGATGAFVKDKLVNLAIRKGKRPKFLINANICLASDFTKTHIRFQDYCYSIENMKMKGDEGISLTQNLINNSVIRGSKISNIAAGYKDWFDEFKQRSRDYQDKLRKKQAEEQKRLKAEAAAAEQAAAAVSQNENRSSPDIYKANIFVPTEELILDPDNVMDAENFGVDINGTESSGVSVGAANAGESDAESRAEPEAASVEESDAESRVEPEATSVEESSAESARESEAAANAFKGSVATKAEMP